MKPFQFIILSIFVIVVTVITTLSTNAFIKNQSSNNTLPNSIKIYTSNGFYQFAFGKITAKNLEPVPGEK